jgi:hypothetical protein
MGMSAMGIILILPRLSAGKLFIPSEAEFNSVHEHYVGEELRLLAQYETDGLKIVHDVSPSLQSKFPKLSSIVLVPRAHEALRWNHMKDASG